MITSYLIGFLFGFIAAIACGYMVRKHKNDNNDEQTIIPNC